MKTKGFCTITIIIFFTILLLLSFSTLSAAEKTGAKGEAWKKELLKERKEKDAEFKEFPTSPMCRSQRLDILADGKEMFVVETADKVKLSPKKLPGAGISVINRDGQWIWKPLAAGVACKKGDKVIAPGTPLPGSFSITLGRCILKGYAQKTKLLVLVHDPHRKEFKNFHGLYYFPPAPEFAVPARLEVFKTFEPMTVNTSQKEQKTFYRYAYATFKLAGKDYKLLVFKFSLDRKSPEWELLFIPFSDATSGKETYEVGRFLEFHEPEGTEFVLDFNRCYNPLCNYSPGYNCPLPPLENHMDLRITAGEKTYPH